MNKILVIGALPESLINFRGEFIKSLAKKMEVTAMASSEVPNVIKRLKDINVTFQAVPIQRNGLNPFVDFKTWLFFRNYFNKAQPNIIFAYTIKPIIWGGLASKVVPKNHFYALLTGLGFAFQGGSYLRNLLSYLVVFMYKYSLKNAKMVIFQNPDNMELFISKEIIPKHKGVLVNGSGVDLNKFQSSPLPKNSKPVFLSIGRLLGEKGFREYAEAAKIVKEKYPNAIFQLLGPEDPSPDGLSLDEVKLWQQDDIVDYLGSTNNVQPFIESCHIYVLPSYHEGMPRTVLEAMATGRPILTTDVPGCRETVNNGVNGYLVPKQNVSALAEKMTWFIENRDQWEAMGKHSRKIAEDKYDVHKVNLCLMEIMGIQ